MLVKMKRKVKEKEKMIVTVKAIKMLQGRLFGYGGFRWTSASFSLKSSRVDADTTEDGRAFQSLITDGKKLYL